MKSFISRKTKDFEKWDFFSFCVVLTFAVFCGALSISVGLSCADDAWQANIAQNIAMGKGYTFPWSYSFDESEPLAFPPWNSCGPAFILPLAFGIRLLPFSEATPGLCTVGLWLLLLLVSGILLRSFLSGRQVFTASVVFVATLLVSFGWHFEQWYASLGEVVAALYLVISIILLSRSEGRAPIFISGIIFSFALLSKPPDAESLKAHAEKIRRRQSSDLRKLCELVLDEPPRPVHHRLNCGLISKERANEEILELIIQSKRTT